MRILQIGPFPPPHGGIQTHIKAIHDELASGGDKGSVLAITRNSSAESKDVFKPGNAFLLGWYLISLKYDVVHLHLGGELTARLALLMLVCGLLPGKRSIVTFHSGGYASANRNNARPRSLRGIAFRSVDHAIAVNDQVVELLDRYGVKSERLSLIPPFVARRPPADVVLDPRLDEFFNGRNPRLLSVSLLEPEYALDVQVAALGSVLKRFPNAGLLIAGGGSLLGQVKKLIDESPYRDHLFLAGDLDHDQTLRTIELADVLLRPTHYDGDALSIREALFLGTRVIATDNGMRPEGVALIPIPPDASHLARKIIETLEGGLNGTAPTDSDGRENIEAVISLYKRLLNGKEDA